jgi:hypothetical protein
MSPIVANLVQGAHDLTCFQSDNCRSMSGWTFVVLYMFAMVVRHVIFYVWIKGSYFQSRIQLEGEERALNTITASAIDLSAILQFVAWVPIGVGFFKTGNFYLFMMPMFQELYDVVYLNFVHRKRFNSWLVKFVMQHHVLSTLGRIGLAAMIYGFVPAQMRGFVFESILLFYSCSAFLIAPAAFEPFFAVENIRGRAMLRLACFVLARVCHFLVVGRFAWAMAENVDARTCIAAVTISTVIYGITEVHSVINGLPRLRGDWRRAARSSRELEAAPA